MNDLVMTCAQALGIVAYALWFALVFVPHMNSAPDIEDRA